jgi:hypothetical protein
MKIQFSQIIALMVVIFSSAKVKAQEKFNTYENSYIQKTYPIQISVKDKDDYSLYIDAFSLDKIHSDGGITIKKEQYQDFVKALTEAKGKYEEWVKIAKENNIKEFDKSMNISSVVDGYFMYGAKWNFQFGVFLKFDFIVREIGGNVQHLLLVKTGELQSSRNEYIKVDGFALVFTSAKEIDEFLAKISVDKINEFQNKPKKEDLFKD